MFLFFLLLIGDRWLPVKYQLLKECYQITKCRQTYRKKLEKQTKHSKKQLHSRSATTILILYLQNGS